ncbi:MAG TPA: hypothetical protein PLK31_15705 [Chloroflexota bacterium]|nr:hypothetical protein [Chloroflexota bacterium]
MALNSRSCSMAGLLQATTAVIITPSNTQLQPRFTINSPPVWPFSGNR